MASSLRHRAVAVAGAVADAGKYVGAFVAALLLPFLLFPDSWLLQTVALLAGLYAAAWYGHRLFGRG